MKSCLALIGGLVVVCFGLAFCAAIVGGQGAAHHLSALSATSARGRHATNVGTSQTDSCSVANERERSAADALNAGQNQKAYDLTISGLHYNESCDDDTTRLINKGYFMSFKATAEHYLSSGDWQTDLNEANALLVQCQTTPGVYGTHTGAQCETQENTNIHNSTSWEMGE